MGVSVSGRGVIVGVLVGNRGAIKVKVGSSGEGTEELREL